MNDRLLVAFLGSVYNLQPFLPFQKTYEPDSTLVKSPSGFLLAS